MNQADGFSSQANRAVTDDDRTQTFLRISRADQVRAAPAGNLACADSARTWRVEHVDDAGGAGEASLPADRGGNCPGPGNNAGAAMAGPV